MRILSLFTQGFIVYLNHLGRWRRAVKHPNYDCSKTCPKERFYDLCTEAGERTPTSMREAITALQLEADGIVFNVRRDPLATNPDGKACDFLIDGPNGETHLEIRGPVDRKIKIAHDQIPSVSLQGKRIGNKTHKQVLNWCSDEWLQEKNVAMTKVEFREKVIVAIDLFDVSIEDKAKMERHITTKLSKAAEPAKIPVQKVCFLNNLFNR